MKGLILYRSNYGCTRQYAEWLAEETGFDAVDFRHRRSDAIRDADAIIFGSPILAGRPMMARWMIKNRDRLRGKTLRLFTTSGAPASDPQNRTNFEATFPADLRDAIGYFPMGGRMIFSELKPLHRFMMKLGQKMVKDEDARANMLKDKDSMDRSHLRPLVESLG